MAVCEVCGNDYEMSFEVVAQGARHTFDSFECAIHKMAPICEHCGVKVVGHGVVVEGSFYCCAQCARHERRHGRGGGVPGLVDGPADPGDGGRVEHDPQRDVDPEPVPDLRGHPDSQEGVAAQVEEVVVDSQRLA